MKLSRRMLAPAVLGGALAAPEAVKAAIQGGRGPFPPAYPPPIPRGYGVANTCSGEAQNTYNLKDELLSRKAQLERWVRGEFEEGELDQHGPHDPWHRPFDHAQHEIAGLKSVSTGHKMRMTAALARQRYLDYRKNSAALNLADIIKRLAGL